MLMILLPVTLGVIVLCWDRYFCCKREKNKSVMILYKCTSTLMCAVMAFAGAVVSGGNPLTSLPFWGALLCALGDGLLEVRFLAGMGAFALGHVVYIGWICMLFAAVNAPVWPVPILWAVFYAAALMMFKTHWKRLGKALPAFLLYGAVLMTMAAMAVLLPAVLGAQALCIAVGGALFALSDLFVAKGIFVGLSRKADRFALAIYYAAVYLLSMAAWLM